MTSNAASSGPDPRALVVLDRAILLTLLALCGFLALGFGGVLAWGHLAAVLGTALLGALLSARWIAGAPVVISWTFVPLVLFVALVAVQALPLPLSLVQALAPATAEAWQRVQSELPDAAASAHLSLYPRGTLADLRLLGAGVLLFAVVVNTFRHRAQIQHLLAGLAAIGGLVATIGILQNLTETNKLLWFMPTPGLATAGPFVHYGHFSQFLNLTLGAGLALLFLRLDDRTKKAKHQPDELLKDLGSVQRRADLWLFAFFVLVIVAIAMSRSRNGLISILVAGAVAAAAMHWTRYLRGIGWALLAIAFVAFLALLVLGFDPIYNRMATLEDTQAVAGRLDILRDSLALGKSHLLVGAGQGAYEYAFPGFDTSERPNRAQHAENQYVELFAETGILGVLLALALGALLVHTFVRRVTQRDSATDAMLFGLVYGVVAVAFHALSDFGLRIPAVAALMLVSLALVAARGPRLVLTSKVARVAGALTCAGVAVLLALQTPALRAAWAADQHVRQANALQPKLPQLEGKARYEMLQEQLTHLRAARTLAPDDVEVRVRLASIGWQVAASTVPAGVSIAPQTTPNLVAVAKVAQKELVAALHSAPTYGVPWSLLGNLGLYWLGDARGVQWIHRGRELSPEDPETCIASARLLVADRNSKGATQNFVRALRLGASGERVFDVVLSDLQKPEIAREVVRGNAAWSLELYQRLQGLQDVEHMAAAASQPSQPSSVGPGKYQAWIDDLRGDTRSLLERRCIEADPPAWYLSTLARFCLEEGGEANEKSAIRHYRRALTLQPDSQERYELARLLAKHGEFEVARTELQRLLNYQRDHGAAKQLLLEIQNKR